MARYYEGLAANIEFFAHEAKWILTQKLELGLIAGESEDAIKKLKRLEVSTDLERVRIVLALIDLSPDSTQLRIEELQRLPFANQIVIFRLGYGLWDEYAQKVTTSSGAIA